MQAHDLDLVARLVGNACTRRRALKALAAGGWLAVSGSRLRLDALAADLCCCKCSGTKKCEDDVASLSECRQLCGTKQAIFSCNHTCEPGKSISKVCKLRKKTGAAITASVPGVYDLAFFDAVGAVTYGPGAVRVSEAIFTSEAAQASGYAGETGGPLLYSEGVYSFHSVRTVDNGQLTLISFLSQHASIEAAETWRNYAAGQLWPPEAEEHTEELSQVDVADLHRFTFPSSETEGETVTRLAGITRIGEFVHWFSIEGIDTIPDPETGSRFQQAVADAIADQPEQTESLAPLAWLPDETLACVTSDELAGSAGAIRASLIPSAQNGACLVPALNVRYTVLGGRVQPAEGAADEAIEQSKAFYAGAQTSMTYTYFQGAQLRTLTITRWSNTDVVASDGATFFKRLAKSDELNGVVRTFGATDNPLVDDPSNSTFGYPTANGLLIGAEKTVFNGSYSFSLRVVQAGSAPDIATWIPAEDPNVTLVLNDLGSGSSNTQLETVQFGNLENYLRNTPVYGVNAPR